MNTKTKSTGTQEESKPRHLGIEQETFNCEIYSKVRTKLRGQAELSDTRGPLSELWSIPHGSLGNLEGKAIRILKTCFDERSKLVKHKEACVNSTFLMFHHASSELFYLLSNVPALKKHMSEDPSSKWTHQSINEAQSILVLWELDHPFGDFHNFTHDPTDTWVVHKVKIAARWTLITNPVPAVATCLDFWPCLDTTSKHCIMLHSTETRTACHACLTSILQPFQGLTNSFRSAYVDSCFRAVHKHTQHAATVIRSKSKLLQWRTCATRTSSYILGRSGRIHISKREPHVSHNTRDCCFLALASAASHMHLEG